MKGFCSIFLHLACFEEGKTIPVLGVVVPEGSKEENPEGK